MLLLTSISYCLNYRCTKHPLHLHNATQNTSCVQTHAVARLLTWRLNLRSAHGARCCLVTCQPLADALLTENVAAGKHAGKHRFNREAGPNEVDNDRIRRANSIQGAHHVLHKTGVLRAYADTACPACEL
jgi:hypothetical protein